MDKGAGPGQTRSRSSGERAAGEGEEMSRLPLAISDRSTLLSELQETIQGEARFDRLSRALYSTDASVFQIVPFGVVLPRTEDDIVATVRACGRAGVPLT